MTGGRRYEGVNAETGDEVPWKDIVKTFEYDKGSYVVLDADDIKSAAPGSHESIDIEAFVDADATAPAYFEEPYLLVPGKKAEKSYVLLRKTLRKPGRIRVGRGVVRTRERLSAVLPQTTAEAMANVFTRAKPAKKSTAKATMKGAKPASEKRHSA